MKKGEVVVQESCLRFDSEDSFYPGGTWGTSIAVSTSFTLLKLVLK